MQAEADVRDCVRQHLSELLAHPTPDEALIWTLPYGADHAYQEAVHQQLRRLVMV